MNILKKTISLCQDSFHIHTLESINNEMQTLIEEDNNVLYVAIRGSDSLWDWLNINTNIKLIYPFIDDKIGVHEGFYFAKNLILDTFLTYYKINNLEDYEKVIFTGFSMGSSVAQIISLIFKNLYPNKFVGCITYANPKIGNKEFQKYFQNNLDYSLSINNFYDLVTYFVPNYINPASNKIVKKASLLNFHDLETYKNLINNIEEKSITLPVID